MIQVKLTIPAGDPIWDRWRKDSDTALAELEISVKNGIKPEIKEIYKRKSIKDKYYFSVDWCFHGKCAYCETKLSEAGHPDIEHYRPKLGVTDENDTVIEVDYGKGSESHRGYWWLAYCVTNLMPACQKCNQASLDGAGNKIGKHNRFPVGGNHARSPTEIDAEQPLLINPIAEDPALHLLPDTETGRMKAVDGSNRGTTTIKILGLNVRDDLVNRRQQKTAELKMLIIDALTNNNIKSIIKIKELCADSSEFSSVARAFVSERKILIGNLLKT